MSILEIIKNIKNAHLLKGSNIFMEIMQNRLDREFQENRQEYEDAILKVIRSGCYILGEKEISNTILKIFIRN